MNTQPLKTQAEGGKESSSTKAFYALMIMIALAVIIMIAKLAGLF